MDRRTKLLGDIDIAHAVGIEIGALCRPFVTRGEGRVFYIDHADTDTLRTKYQNDPDVDVNALVKVDVVWGDKPLREAIPERVDYVIASHVVEHVPDLISWLGELASVLRPEGEIRLIVPDRRFTFDYLRDETTLSHVAYAHMMQARAPLPHIVLDYVLNVVKMDSAVAWRGEVSASNLERHHTLQHAMTCAAQARDGAYHDVRCWVFTPAFLRNADDRDSTQQARSVRMHQVLRYGTDDHRVFRRNEAEHGLRTGDPKLGRYARELQRAGNPFGMTQARLLRSDRIRLGLI